MPRLQLAQIVHRKRAMIIFEGWDGAGKKAALEAARRRRGTRATSRPAASAAATAATTTATGWRRSGARCPPPGDTTIFYRSWYRRVIDDRALGLHRRQALGARLRRDQRVRGAAARPWHADRQAVLPRLRRRCRSSGCASGRTTRGAATSSRPTTLPTRDERERYHRRARTTCSRRPTRAGRRGG